MCERETERKQARAKARAVYVEHKHVIKAISRSCPTNPHTHEQTHKRALCHVTLSQTTGYNRGRGKKVAKGRQARLGLKASTSTTVDTIRQKRKGHKNTQQTWKSRHAGVIERSRDEERTGKQATEHTQRQTHIKQKPRMLPRRSPLSSHLKTLIGF